VLYPLSYGRATAEMLLYFITEIRAAPNFPATTWAYFPIGAAESLANNFRGTISGAEFPTSAQISAQIKLVPLCRGVIISNMYLDRTYRPRRRPRGFIGRFWPLILLAALAIILYEQQPTWLMPANNEPTPTPTRAAIAFITDAEAAYRTGNMDEALAAYEQAARLEPDNPAPFAAISSIYLILQEYDQSLAWAEQAVNIDNRNVDALNALARIKDWLGDYEEAVNYAFDALDEDPENATTLAILGEVYTDVGNWTQAESYLERALENEPLNITALRNRAFLYEMRGDYESAVEYYQKAIDAAPYRFDLYVGLGRQFRLGFQDFERANEAYRQAVDVYAAPLTLAALGDGLYNAGDHLQAVRVLRQAVEMNEEYGPARVYLGMTLYARRNFEDAAEHLERGIELLGDRARIEHYYTLGLAHVYKEPRECDKAVYWLEKAREIAPNFSPILQGLASCGIQ
jgi:tetratricopeptide (TPR) repeat protein